MKEIRRVLHDYANVLTSASGFIELAFAEPERVRRYDYLMRAQKELRRAIVLAGHMRTLIDAVAIKYGEDEFES